MSLFGNKKKDDEHAESVVGVDIGTFGIKIVEVAQEHAKPRLETYGYAEMPVGDADAAAALTDDQKVADIVRRIMTDAKMKSTKAIAALPSSEALHAIISVPAPRSSKDELKPLVENAARKIFTTPLEDLILDSHVLDKDLLPTGKEKPAPAKPEPTPEERAAAGGDAAVKEAVGASSEKQKYIRVLLTAAPRKLVARYVDIFKLAKLELVSLETEVFALIRSLIGAEETRIMIVDVGAERTNIVIAEKGIPFLTRSVTFGGNEITQALASSMGVGAAEAETMKRDLAFRSQSGLPKALQDALKSLTHELRYAIELFAEQEFHESRTVEKVLVTGGSSALPGLAKYFTDALGVNVYVADPWARLATVPASRGVLDEVGARFAVAVGLALREKESM